MQDLGIVNQDILLPTTVDVPWDDLSSSASGLKTAVNDTATAMTDVGNVWGGLEQAYQQPETQEAVWSALDSAPGVVEDWAETMDSASSILQEFVDEGRPLQERSEQLREQASHLQARLSVSDIDLSNPSGDEEESEADAELRQDIATHNTDVLRFNQDWRNLESRISGDLEALQSAHGVNEDIPEASPPSHGNPTTTTSYGTQVAPTPPIGEEGGTWEQIDEWTDHYQTGKEGMRTLAENLLGKEGMHFLTRITGAISAFFTVGTATRRQWNEDADEDMPAFRQAYRAGAMGIAEGGGALTGGSIGAMPGVPIGKANLPAGIATGAVLSAVGANVAGTIARYPAREFLRADDFVWDTTGDIVDFGTDSVGSIAESTVDTVNIGSNLLTDNQYSLTDASRDLSYTWNMNQANILLSGAEMVSNIQDNYQEMNQAWALNAGQTAMDLQEIGENTTELVDNTVEGVQDAGNYVADGIEERTGIDVRFWN